MVDGWRCWPYTVRTLSNEVDGMDNSELISRLESASNTAGRDSDCEVMQDAIVRIQELEAEVKRLQGKVSDLGWSLNPEGMGR